ncbi:hypothetical protein L3i22_033120 [Actinoplanes sp. L3-i22]|nr:hypothetical protein L3i22_033120 [Actinoplanes sp. L3-i22]
MPAHGIYAVAVSPRRMIYRQRDWQGLAIIGLALGLIPVVTWLTWPASSATFSLMLVALAVAVYLGGPGTSVVVTPDAVVIRNFFRSWRVARSLVIPRDPHHDELDTSLPIKGYPSVDIAAFHTTFNHQPMREGPWWLVEALQQVGALPDDGLHVRRIRWLNVALALGIIAAFAWAHPN